MGKPAAPLHADLTVTEVVDQGGRKNMRIAGLIRLRVVVRYIAEPLAERNVFVVQIGSIHAEVETVFAEILIQSHIVLDGISERVGGEGHTVDHGKGAGNVSRRGAAAPRPEGLLRGLKDLDELGMSKRVINQDIRTNTVGIG